MDFPRWLSLLFFLSRREQKPRGAQQAEAAMAAAPPSTVPTIASALDVDFDSDSSQDPLPVLDANTTSVGVDFDDPTPPEIPPGTSAVPGTIMNPSLTTVSLPASESMPVLEAGVDFDSDSCPTGPTSPVPVSADMNRLQSNVPAEMDLAAAIGVDFDVVSPPAAAGTIGVGFDEDDEDLSARPESTSKDDGVGDEPPRSTLPGKGSAGGMGNNRQTDQAAAHDGRNQQSRGSATPQQQKQNREKVEHPTTTVPSRVCGEGQAAAVISTQERGDCGGGGVAATTEPAKKRRRCGTVCLGGMATERGYCASSLSQR